MTVNARLTVEDHPMSVKRFERVLGLYCGAIQTLKETQLTDPVESQYLNGAIGMLLNAAAALELAREPQTVFGNQPQFQVTAPLAIPLSVIARAAIESYNALFHTVLNPDANLRETMKLFFCVDGLRRRNQYTAYNSEHQEQQRDEIQEMHRLQALLDGRNPPPIKLIKDQLPCAGFGVQTVLELYAVLSQYAHGGYIAVLQAGQMNDDQLRGDLRTNLTFVALALTMTLRHLGDRFQAVRDHIDADEWGVNELFLLNHLARCNDHGQRKGLLIERDKLKRGRVIVWEAETHPDAVPETFRITFEGTSGEAWNHFELESGDQDIWLEGDARWHQPIRWQPWS